MNLLELAIKIFCDDQTSGPIQNIASKVTGAIGTAAKAAGVAAAAAGAGLVAVGKSALDAYSNYEQLVGGVDTLFKESSATVQRYAQDAYKTAGVSANTYMEQATAFSASLIQSLGGDTQKAAEYANTAINDMSDKRIVRVKRVELYQRCAA